uniref:BHLH domain-containing protein n=1 Tax=Oryza rufipogon TaxID=4529 RepID=A0A0E0MZI1_ORYRU
MDSVQQLQAKQAAQHYTYKAHTSHATSAVALLLLLSSPLLSSPLLPPKSPSFFLVLLLLHEATSASPPRDRLQDPILISPPPTNSSRPALAVRRSHLQENPFPLWFFVLDDIGCVKIENVELKRFRIVKEVGTIVMNVRIFAYYQLMQVCQRDPTAFTGNPSFAYGHEADGYIANGPLGGQCNYRVPVSPAFGAPSGMTSPQLRTSLGGFEFQPSRLNPSATNAFPSYPEPICRSSGQDNGNLEEVSSSFKEDTREIDALLSSDEESDEDDVKSTGRTPDCFESDSLDSSSPPRSRKMHHSSSQSSVFHGSMDTVTHERMRNMVTVLRGIIPGGDQLDTASVIEEAVRYLKFLKMEAKKLGVEVSDN